MEEGLLRAPDEILSLAWSSFPTHIFFKNLFLQPFQKDSIAESTHPLDNGRHCGSNFFCVFNFFVMPVVQSANVTVNRYKSVTE